MKTHREMSDSWMSSLFYILLLVLLPKRVQAQTEDEDEEILRTLLIVLIVILVILLALFLFFWCCFRQWVATICPCLVARVTPEEASEYYHVNRFGETKIKYATYKMSEVMPSDKDNESVHTNVSLQVPLYEEMLGSSVAKKSVHVTERAPRQGKKSRRADGGKSGASEARAGGAEVTAADDSEETHVYDEIDVGGDPATMTPRSLPAIRGKRRPPTVEPGETTVVRRPPSAFNKPKPRLEEVPFADFIPSERGDKAEATRPKERIYLDSDEDSRC